MSDEAPDRSAAAASAADEVACDVLVVGGGPAGSTIAALLAQRGRDVEFDTGDGPLVGAVASDGTARTWRPRFVVDASGRDTLMASKLGIKAVDKRNNTAAIFGHFTGVPRRDGAAAGNITIHLVE